MFHIFKGGSDFAGIREFNGAALGVLHMNDYPAGLLREKATDADRVYPGAGVAPLVGLVGDLLALVTAVISRWSFSIMIIGNKTRSRSPAKGAG